MQEFIIMWWPVLPTIMAIASIIARITSNETDNKVVAVIQKIIDTIAFSSAPTKLNKRILK